MARAHHRQSDPVTHTLALALKLHLNQGRAARKQGRKWCEMQADAPQIAMTDMHAHQRAARQQEREQVAQVELVVDG